MNVTEPQIKLQHISLTKSKEECKVSKVCKFSKLLKLFMHTLLYRLQQLVQLTTVCLQWVMEHLIYMLISSKFSDNRRGATVLHSYNN